MHADWRWTATPARSGTRTPRRRTAPAAAKRARTARSRSPLPWRPRPAWADPPVRAGGQVGGPVVAQHAEQPPHLRQRLARNPAQRAELGQGRLGQAGEAVRRRLGPDGDQRHVMGDHVVQFPRDPGALLKHGSPLLLVLDSLRLRGQGELRAQPGAGAVHHDRHGREDHGGADRAVQVRQVGGEPQPPRDEASAPTSSPVPVAAGGSRPGRTRRAARPAGLAPTASRPTSWPVPAGPAAAPAIRSARPASGSGRPAAAAPRPARPAAAGAGFAILARLAAQSRSVTSASAVLAVRRSCGDCHRHAGGGSGPTSTWTSACQPSLARSAWLGPGSGTGRPFHAPSVWRQVSPVHHASVVIPGYQYGLEPGLPSFLV